MATLLLENGPDRGKGLELKPGETYTIGRDPGCQLVIHGELVSRQHARLKEFKGAYYVKDLDSLNGVFLNDQRVQQAELKPGDKLQLGDVVLTFLDESLAKSKEEKILGGYRLLERVGRGGMGTVYRAIQISLDREVALKLLSPELVRDKLFVEQFFREARAAGQLNHPHIVQVYDVGQVGETYYYSMEYVRGGSLEDRLRTEGKLTVPEALRIALEAAMALEYAESRHIVHRDVKPDNLMLAEDGRVRVADLGLALSLKTSADHKGQPILGTPHFISPEQALRRDVDIRSDIYSLGATMYRMLAGRTLFTGSSAEEIIKKAVRDEPEPLRTLNPEVPEKVAALVHRMLKKVPDERFASAKELRDELEKLTRHPGRTKALMAAVAVAVIAVGAAITFALKKPETQVVIQDSPDSIEAKLRAFEAKSEADKRKVELEAVRSYLTLFESPRDGAATREDLLSWLKTYDYLDLPEHRRARERAKEIEETVARQEAERAQLEQARNEALAAARASVQEPLARGELVAAFASAAAIDPAKAADESTRAALDAERTKLLGEVRTKLDAERVRREQEIESAIAVGDITQALALSQAAEQAWLPPEGMSEAIAAELATAREAFATRRGDLEQRANVAQVQLVERDAERVADAYSALTREAVLALDLGAAAERVEKILEQLETAPARAELEPFAKTLRHGEALVTQVLSALEEGKLAADPPFRLPGAERPSELAGFDREKRLVKLSTRAGRGASSTSVPLADLASAAALRQLVYGRAQLPPEQYLDLADLMITVQVVRWAEGIAPLAARTSRYDPKVGWTDDLRQGLAAPPASELDQEVAMVLKDVPPAQVDAAERLRSRAVTEQQCQSELFAALEPFLRSDSSIGWAASSQALARLMKERRDTLLLRLVSPWITGGA